MNLAVILQENVWTFKQLLQKITLLFQNYSWFFLPQIIPKIILV